MEEWFDLPMRWAQLTLVENDPVSFDVQFWLDYIQSIHADAACLSAGGVVAFYPTDVPLHHRSAWLGDKDPFGDLVEGCRKMDIVVVARTDSHAVHQNVMDAHPDWVAVSADGHPRRHWSSPEMWVACALGPYSFEFMPQIHREIMTRYQPDGIFTNRWEGSGICYCEHCRKRFRQACGLDLPLAVQAADPAWRKYVRWYQERLFEVWKLWDGEIRARKPGARFIPNAGGGSLYLLDMCRIGELADTLFADQQGRHGLMPIWSIGKDAKEFRATLGKKPIVGIYSVGLETPYRWKDSVQNEAEMRLWVLDGIANGFRPWITKFSGKLYDQRWLKTVKDLYDWHYQNERYLREEKPLAQVAIVYSQQTAVFYGGSEAQGKVEDPILGIYQALVEMRIPFEMVHDGRLERDNLDQFELLILPNVAALSNHQCNQLRAYIERGGSLIATNETSLYDENGIQRSDFGLADLFGIHYLDRQPGPIKNAYLCLEWPPQGEEAHPLLRGFEGAGRIINGTSWVDVEPSKPLDEIPLTLIPAYPDLPMEKVYPRLGHTLIPGVYLRTRGKGRVAYFPWDIDRTFWEILCGDHGRLLWNTVDWALNGKQMITVTGPGILDITVWQQANSITVHLVNLTNPMYMKGPVREFIPVGPQQIKINLPEGKNVRRVHRLVDRAMMTIEENEGALICTVPSILDHEVIAIDF
jgi:hypothetical protein